MGTVAIFQTKQCTILLLRPRVLQGAQNLRVRSFALVGRARLAFRTRRSANLSRKPRDGKLGFAVLARWLVVLVGLDRFRVKLFFYSFLSFVLPRNFLVALLLRWYLFFDTQVL